jgi:hypothetical protein
VPTINRKLAITLSTYAVLAILAFFTLDGTIRLATSIFLGAFAFKTWLVVLKDRQD